MAHHAGAAPVLARPGREQDRLAREIHDTLAQGYVGISSQLEAVSMLLPKEYPAQAGQYLNLAQKMAHHSLTEAPDVSVMDLRNRALEGQTLAQAMDQTSRMMTAGRPLKATVEAPADFRWCPRKRNQQLLRIAQEALNNALEAFGGHRGDHRLAAGREQPEAADRRQRQRFRRQQCLPLRRRPLRAVGHAGTGAARRRQPASGNGARRRHYNRSDGPPAHGVLRHHNSKRIGFSVAEDHLIAVGISTIVAMQSDMTVVAEALNGAHAVQLHRQYRPDITLMDIRMPVMTGFEAMSSIRSEWPNARFVALSTYGGDEDIRRALQCGAQAYLTKEVLHDELLKAIRAVHSGQTYLPAPVAAALAAEFALSRPQCARNRGAAVNGPGPQ
ncbi:MAG: response regulator [Paludibaculum sp.]